MRAAILILTLFVCGSSFVDAQSRRRLNARHGLWIGAGFGSGSAAFECPSCDTDRFSGASGYFRIGGTLSRHILIGVETNGWLNSEGGVDERIGFGSIVVLWYPSATGALYLKAGLGGMTYRADDGFDQLTATAPSASIGIGYEFRVGRNVSVVPFVNSLISSAVQLRFDGVPIGTGEDISINLFQFGLGVNFH